MKKYNVSRKQLFCAVSLIKWCNIRSGKYNWTVFTFHNLETGIAWSLVNPCYIEVAESFINVKLLNRKICFLPDNWFVLSSNVVVHQFKIEKYFQIIHTKSQIKHSGLKTWRWNNPQIRIQRAWLWMSWFQMTESKFASSWHIQSCRFKWIRLLTRDLTFFCSAQIMLKPFLYTIRWNV